MTPDITELPKITGKFSDYEWIEDPHYHTMKHDIYDLCVSKCDHGIKYMSEIFTTGTCNFIAHHANGFDTLNEAKAECIRLFNGLTIAEVNENIAIGERRND